MKIFIPSIRMQDIGGSSIFTKKFSEALRAKGHEVFFERPEDYDVLFVVIQCFPHHLLDAKLHKKKIIQRLDGTYYWSVAHWKYPFLNFPASFIHRFFADVTIYQSFYSQYCARLFLGKSHSKKQHIIYNGVDTDLFSPDGERIDTRDNPEQQVFFSASKFRRPDQVLPLIEAMRVYQSEINANSKLVLAGSFSGRVSNVPEEYKHLSYLHFLGKVPNTDLPKYERSADVFVFTHLNPPCPNNIIEAMACGLPICGVADGAMEELTEPGVNSLLLSTKGDAFWHERRYNIKEFAANMHVLVQKRDVFSEASRRMAVERFSLDKMLDRYLEALADS